MPAPMDTRFDTGRDTFTAVIARFNDGTRGFAETRMIEAFPWVAPARLPAAPTAPAAPARHSHRSAPKR
jgi:hypothetical protein